MAQSESDMAGLCILEEVKQSDLLLENQIVIGPYIEIAQNTLGLGHDPSKEILIVGSAIDQFGTTFAGLYEMQTKLVMLNIGNQKLQGVRLISNVGLKGWEAKAIGTFPKRQGLNFNLQYQYSFEDLILNGTGSRIKLVKEF